VRTRRRDIDRALHHIQRALLVSRIERQTHPWAERNIAEEGLVHSRYRRSFAVKRADDDSREGAAVIDQGKFVALVMRKGRLDLFLRRRERHPHL